MTSTRKKQVYPNAVSVVHQRRIVVEQLSPEAQRDTIRVLAGVAIRLHGAEPKQFDGQICAGPGNDGGLQLAVQALALDKPPVFVSPNIPTGNGGALA